MEFSLLPPSPLKGISINLRSEGFSFVIPAKAGIQGGLSE